MTDLLARLLAESGYPSASALARKACVSIPLMSMMMNGKREPKLATMKRLLQAAGFPWAWLDASWAPDVFDPVEPPTRGPGRPRKVTATTKGHS